MGILKNIFSDNVKDLKKMTFFANKVNALANEYSNKTDEELRNKTQEFKNRLNNGETLDDISYEAFATIREVSKRINNEYPFLVQLMAGYVLHKGDLAEAVTGSGKTLSSVAPAYLNALTGKGVHIITVNEYLSERDSIKNGRIFNFLGLSVGLNKKGLSLEDKQEAYKCDITYTTNSELGFDYLRDNMVKNPANRVLRGLNYVIIDEADSVLIDDARTPLIISGGERGDINKYICADNFVKTLNENDYEIEIKHKDIQLTEEGMDKANHFYKVKNIYDVENSEIVHYLLQALKANYVMKKDVDYLVENGDVILVDQSTGRKMEGREFCDGLHQAIQAKEKVEVKLESMTQATITYQNFFRLYNKVSGMTGTAKTEEEEFLEIYNMRVVVIPTNEPVIRNDLEDRIFGTKDAKYNAIIKEVSKLNAIGRPVLIGTPSVEVSEIISKRLSKAKLKHEVLNAKNHAREAEIIAKAGCIGTITVATNMAGRGTDIKLGEGVKNLGGLAVIGVERHESRRIDNQLRGRSGRQGDPGSSQFFVSMEDDLMKRFGSDKAKDMLTSLGNMEVVNPFLTKSITSAQESVEGMHYDARKALLNYDNVMSEQREIIYNIRNQILDKNKAHDFINDMQKRYIHNFVLENTKKINHKNIIDKEALDKFTNNINLRSVNETKVKKIEEVLINNAKNNLDSLKEEIGDHFEKAEQLTVLTKIDEAWTEHIDTLYKLRDGIGLRGYSSENPLNDYVNEAYDLFNEMLDFIAENITLYISKMYKGEKNEI